MKRKVITKDCIGILKTINIIPMFIFIWENPLNVWQAGWMLFMFFLEVVYCLYAYKLVAFPHGKIKTLQLDKRAEIYYSISIILSLISTFVVAAVGMTSSNLAIKYTLISIWAVIVIVCLIFQFIVDKKILKAPLIDIEDVDFTKLTDERIECTNSDLENVSVCIAALGIMSFVMLVPMFAIIFVDTLNIALWIYIPGVVLSILFLLIAYCFTYKFTKKFKKHMIITFLIYLVAQIVEGVIIYLVHRGVDLSDDVRRGVVIGAYFISFICLWIILMAPSFKHFRAMKAYIQENEKPESSKESEI